MRSTDYAAPNTSQSSAVIYKIVPRNQFFLTSEEDPAAVSSRNLGTTFVMPRAARAMKFNCDVKFRLSYFAEKTKFHESKES